MHSAPPIPPRTHCRNGPSQQRLRARRAEERANIVAENSTLGDVNNTLLKEATENVVKVTDDTETEKVTTESNDSSEKVDSDVENSEKDFPCDLCDFKSNWENGLRIHMSRKHSKLDQLDGNSDSCQDDEKYMENKDLLDKRMAWVCLSDIS